MFYKFNANLRFKFVTESVTVIAQSPNQIPQLDQYVTGL
jgi:hypothetical protein